MLNVAQGPVTRIVLNRPATRFRGLADLRKLGVVTTRASGFLLFLPATDVIRLVGPQARVAPDAKLDWAFARSITSTPATAHPPPSALG